MYLVVVQSSHSQPTGSPLAALFVEKRRSDSRQWQAGFAGGVVVWGHPVQAVNARCIPGMNGKCGSNSSLHSIRREPASRPDSFAPKPEGNSALLKSRA